MKNSSIFSYLQRIGKALMLPIATLPAAGILLRLGQPDLLNIDFISSAGAAIFSNLPIIFAMGIAVGLSVDGSGAAAIAGAIAYFVLVSTAKTIDAKIEMSVFAGIISGITSGELYNRFYNIKLPEWLSFFAGKRFVPIISAFSCLIIGILMGHVWPYAQAGINEFGHTIQGAGAVGAGIYGFLNRILIPLGLHHILNSYFWFILGDFVNSSGEIVYGDLNRFFALDPTAGSYMTGFFPFLMFGYPAAVLAMYVSAKKEKRKALAGMFISIALTAFLTGIGEPIDFLYLFIAPPLYIIHSVLVGFLLFITNIIGMRLGFTFSAGFIDYVVNFGISEKPLLLIPVGICTSVVYFVIFRYAIVKFNLKTPGREDDTDVLYADQASLPLSEPDKPHQILVALGGENNIVQLGACITRLRVTLKDKSLLDKVAFKQLGASGVLEVENNIQIVFGTKAESIKDDIEKIMTKRS